jgi:peptide/nickel transport system ATP-binding protein
VPAGSFGVPTDSQPRARERRVTAADTPRLDVRGLVAGRRRRLRGGPVAVDGVSLRIAAGETYGLVGESGSGASALADAIARPGAAAGRVLVDGVDLASLDPAARARRVRLFRPATGRPERRTARAVIESEPHYADDLADAVELSASALDTPVHELPDGHRRRVDLARALCTGAEVLVADDPVADLDVTVAAQLLDLLTRLRAQRRLTYLVVARDLGVVRHLSDHVGVLYLGRIVEEAPARALYRSPRHPYTRALLSAVPVPDPEVEDRRERILLLDGPADAPPGGCAFQPRCPWRRPGRCADERPLLRAPAGVAPGHRVACHHAESLG